MTQRYDFQLTQNIKPNGTLISLSFERMVAGDGFDTIEGVSRQIAASLRRRVPA